MFTGIIEGLGTITGQRSAGQGKQLTLEAGFDLSEVKIGDSIAVSGACLTVVKLEARRFTVDVAPETLAKTTLGRVAVGERVNLERALRLSDRLDGHLVSGHVDGRGTIGGFKPAGNAMIITIVVPEELSRGMIKKGSVAVDGVSLTINEIGSDRFELSVIPHTAKLTTIGFKKVGAAVNIETDMIGKYVERFLSGQAAQSGSNSPIDLEFLMKNGFAR